jgi:hypothetical protein
MQAEGAQDNDAGHKTTAAFTSGGVDGSRRSWVERPSRRTGRANSA